MHAVRLSSLVCDYRHANMRPHLHLKVTVAVGHSYSGHDEDEKSEYTSANICFLRKSRTNRAERLWEVGSQRPQGWGKKINSEDFSFLPRSGQACTRDSTVIIRNCTNFR